MPKEIGGKIFYKPGEEGAAPPLTAEELAEIKKRFAAANAQRKPADPDRTPEPKTEENRRFWDDLSGTEYEEWTFPGDDRPPTPRP
ncbi:hypothetical protein [Nocardia beijingensis]|uniref:hypothetical protein n=1 Tax=Nocardia beijingensis TaxID=95162 RepID=UPI0018939C60|nr:hypothetical protein [Nocardia beijingensis]MBF6077957.1 hypothetical protein [Nocardia beijingensis]